MPKKAQLYTVLQKLSVFENDPDEDGEHVADRDQAFSGSPAMKMGWTCS